MPSRDKPEDWCDVWGEGNLNGEDVHATAIPDCAAGRLHPGYVGSVNVRGNPRHTKRCDGINIPSRFVVMSSTLRMIQQYGGNCYCVELYFAG